MKTSIVKELNSVNRLQLSKDFCDYVGIKPKTKVALCKTGNKNELYVLPIEKVENNEVIALINVEMKMRIRIPKSLLQEGEKLFEISVINNKIKIRAVTV